MIDCVVLKYREAIEEERLKKNVGMIGESRTFYIVREEKERNENFRFETVLMI